MDNKYGGVSNAGPVVDLKDIPERLKGDVDSRGHVKMNDLQQEIYDMIGRSLEECGGRGTLSVYQKVWLRKDIEAFIEKKGGLVQEPKLAKDVVTEKDKYDFIMEKIIWEARKIRQVSKGNPFKDWADMERKSREVLNRFGQALPKEVKAELLICCAAMFFIGITSWGKWEK